jgi:tetratricopeptide (TPR) repeat protein
MVSLVSDDKNAIVDNPKTTQVSLVNTFQTDPVYIGHGLYRPMDSLYVSLVYAIAGFTPFFYHLPLLIIHIANALLLYLVLCKLLAKRYALIAALVFLVHPLQVESVTFISGFISPLSFFFGIVAMLLATREKLDWRRNLSICVLIFLSILTKESGIQFVGEILLLRWLFYKKTSWWLYIAMLLGTLGYFAFRFGVGGVGFSDFFAVPIALLPLSERLKNSPAIFWYFLRTFIFPRNLIVDQMWIIKTLTIRNFYRPLVIDIAFIVGVVVTSIVMFWKRSLNAKQFFFFATWYAIGIGLYMQIIPLDATVSDRWFYFPIVGLTGMLVVLMAEFIQHKRNLEVPMYVVTAIIISLLAARTFIRNFDWLTALTLYRHDNAISSSDDLEYKLGMEEAVNGNYKAALKDFQKLAPTWHIGTVTYDLAQMYEANGDYANARATYLQVPTALVGNETQRQKFTQLAEEALGAMAFLHDPPEVAIPEIQQALQIEPSSVNLLTELAVMLYRAHRQEEALVEVQKAIAIQPSPVLSTMRDEIQKGEPITVSISSQ